MGTLTKYAEKFNKTVKLDNYYAYYEGKLYDMSCKKLNNVEDQIKNNDLFKTKTKVVIMICYFRPTLQVDKKYGKNLFNIIADEYDIGKNKIITHNPLNNLLCSYGDTTFKKRGMKLNFLNILGNAVRQKIIPKNKTSKHFEEII